MKILHAAAAAIALFCTSSAQSTETLAGYDRFTVRSAMRAEPVAASVWYPAGTPTYRGLIGDNPVFKGVPVYVGAAIAAGKFPLVVLSHGSGGNMDSLAWLSSALVKRGVMVVAVNHPGSTSGDSSPRRSLLLDERAGDLSAALDMLMKDPAFAPHVDIRHVVALGFSLGGATALNLAGARFDRAAYRDYCARFGKPALDCLFFAKGGVDFDHLPEGFSAQAGDPRITAAIAVDPGFTYALTDESAAAMHLPVLLINLGDGSRMKVADLGESGSNLIHRLPNVQYSLFAPAIHFTFLGMCKPDGARLLAEAQDDPICTDPTGTDRAGIHARIAERVARFLGL